MREEYTALAMLAVGLQVEPAIGAAVGCVLFIALSAGEAMSRQVAFTVSAYGIGYATGTSYVEQGHGMLAAALASALGVTAIVGVHGVISGEKPLAPWMELLRDLINIWRR